MSVAAPVHTIRVALLGNPNTGKTTVFNALCGANQRVGNYPGVTVEKRVGRARAGNSRLEIIDLPGTYSLTARSEDERIAVDELLGLGCDGASSSPPDVVLCIVDATNIERNLLLVSQALDAGRPVVVALTMVDLAEKQGLLIDLPTLEQRIGAPIVPVQARRNRGLDELRKALETVGQAESYQPPPSPLPESVLAAAKEVSVDWPVDARSAAFLAQRAIFDVGGSFEENPPAWLDDERLAAVLDCRARLSDAGLAVPGAESEARFAWAADVAEAALKRPQRPGAFWEDRVDGILTHRLLGTLVFALMMTGLFATVFIVADPLMGGIDAGFGLLAGFVAGLLPDGMLSSLMVDGVVAGVGGVLVFLPQIALLFLLLSILEDCGYMARAAYLMDRLMSRVGLSGKSFVPLLSSFACAVPGVMATRTIENRRDRLVTMLVAPLMSCSARIPVYMIMAKAFIPGPWLGPKLAAVMGMYVLGMVAAVVAALTLRLTMLRGPVPPFVLELPTYRWPHWKNVFYRVLDRSKAFVQQAGTLILATSVLVWAAAYFPGPAEPGGREVARFQNSYLARVGRVVEPAVRPLGWDWKIGCAAIASFPAREVVVSVLGVLHNVEDAEAEEGILLDKLKAARWEGTRTPVYNTAVALSIMVFFALCCQCAATLAVIKRETNSWRWPLFTFTYMTALAYLAALVTYQVAAWAMGIPGPPG